MMKFWYSSMQRRLVNITCDDMLPTALDLCRTARRSVTRSGAFGLLALLAGISHAAEPAVAGDAEPNRHLGVVTCSGSTCHGAPQPLKDSKVMQNEFVTWHREDKHARAYQVLLEEKGQRIAKNLGLENAASAPECLTCHSNYVPEAQRGKRFNLADGVSCEACHGGASGWLGLHVTGEASRADNLAKGMYPTEEPAARAKLCLSCHLGNEQKFATHRIMGAGHPRLSFELDTFTHLQPAHFRADEDYRSRKRVYSDAQVWAVGQVMAAKRSVELFQSAKWQGNGMFPEFAFFDCHACHHRMTDQHWAPRATTGLPPGVPRFNDANMLMLLHLCKQVDPQLGTGLHDALLSLHKATTVSMDETRKAATALSTVLGGVQTKVLAHSFTAEDAKAILGSIVADGAAGEYRDFSGAEQAVMAMASLVDTLRGGNTIDAARWDAGLKALYAVLKDENAYKPDQLVAALKTLESALP